MKTGWHKWFAWYPVRVCAPTPGKRVWLQTVNRLRLSGEWIYDEGPRIEKQEGAALYAAR